MANSFQTKINVELGFGIPGNLYDDGPVRSAPYELVSASATGNLCLRRLGKTGKAQLRHCIP